MSSSDSMTIGALIMFANSTNSSPILVGYFDGNSIKSIPTSGIPNDGIVLQPHYIGPNNPTDFPYIFTRSLVGGASTQIFAYNSDDEIIKSVGPINYPSSSKTILVISYIKNTYVVIAGSTIYYYTDSRFSNIPQSAQYKGDLFPSQGQNGAASLKLLQDGKLYAFGVFPSLNSSKKYGAIVSSDGISWNPVKNSEYDSNANLTMGVYVNGINELDENGSLSGNIVLTGCQQITGSNACNLSCVNSQSCSSQARNLFTPVATALPTTVYLSQVWNVGEGYWGSINFGGATGYSNYRGAVYSKNGVKWDLLYDNSNPISIGDLFNYTTVSEFVYSPTLIKTMVLARDAAGKYNILYNTDPKLNTGWYPVEIPSVYGIPVSITTLPSPFVGSDYEDDDKKELENLTTLQTIWKNYKMVIIFVVVGVIFLFLKLYVNFVKGLRTQQAQIAALSKGSK